jgi:hypothetical protein
VPHLLWHGASVFPVSSEGPPHSVASYNTHGDVENLLLPGFARGPYQSPLTTHKGRWRIYSNPDPHGILALKTGNPVYLISTKGHGRYDQSAEDAYSSLAPDPTFTFFGGLFCLSLHFVFALLIVITFDTLLTLLFCI